MHGAVAVRHYILISDRPVILLRLLYSFLNRGCVHSRLVVFVPVAALWMQGVAGAYWEGYISTSARPVTFSRLLK